MCLAIPGEVLDVRGGDPLMRTGRVKFGGIVKEVSLALVPEAAPGAYVLVHAGIAIQTLDPAEAERTFAFLDEMGEARPEA